MGDGKGTWDIFQAMDTAIPETMLVASVQTYASHALDTCGR